jgi:nicotinamidase-related amidase
VGEWEIDGKPALIVLHMQKGLLGKATIHPERFDAVRKAVKGSGMINRIQTLLKVFREKNLPVVFVNVFHNPLGTSSTYGWLLKTTEEPQRTAGMSEILASSSVREDLEVIPELEPRPDEPLLFNWFLGSFTNSGLDLVLKLKGVKTLVLAGFAAHSIVYHTAVQAVDLWYSVIIPRDATVSPERDQKAYEAVMDIMAPHLALVTLTDDVVAHLKAVF